MNNRALEREAQLWGMFISNPEFRTEITGEDFITEKYRLTADEVHDLEAGRITKDEMRHLPALMESLNLPYGVKYPDGLVSAVKGYSKSKREVKESLMKSWAVNNNK
jgi:hypothetical protein